MLRECAGLPLDELCDRVLERLFLPDAEDDVAMLAVRLHPQDWPRPEPPVSPSRLGHRRPLRRRHCAAVRPDDAGSRARAGRSTATGASQPRHTESTPQRRRRAR